MTNIEHYFENLLTYGKDLGNNAEKLSEEEKEAVEYCYQYLLGSDYQKKLMALSIITRKKVDVWRLSMLTLYGYNSTLDGYKGRQLTEDEYEIINKCL